MSKVLCVICGQWFSHENATRPHIGSCGTVVCKLEHRYPVIEVLLENIGIAEDALLQGLAMNA